MTTMLNMDCFIEEEHEVEKRQLVLFV